MGCYNSDMRSMVEINLLEKRQALLECLKASSESAVISIAYYRRMIRLYNQINEKLKIHREENQKLNRRIKC